MHGFRFVSPHGKTIPYRLLTHKRVLALPPRAFRVLVTLRVLPPLAFHWPNQTTLGAATGLSRQSVNKALAALIASGIIVKGVGEDGMIVYTEVM